MLPKKKSEFEAYLKEHFGKAIENGHLIDYLMSAGLAFFGYRTYGFSGIVIGPLAYKLAKAPAIPASATGVLVLGHMGLTELGLLNHLYEGIGTLTTWISEHVQGFPEWLLGKEAPFPVPMEYTTPAPIMDRRKK